MPYKVAITGLIEEVYDELGLTPENLAKEISDFIN